MSLRLDKIGIWGGIAVACLAGFVGLGLVWQESRSGEKIERLTEQMGAVERSIGAVIDLGKPGIVFLVVSAFISFIVGIVIFRRLGIAHRRALSLKKYVTDVIASVPSGMLILSGDLHILSANPSFRAMMGKPKVDLRKRPLEEISPVADLRNRASEVLAAGTPQDNIVVELPEEDRSLRVAITPIHPSDPEDKARLLLMVEDITELKKAESRTHAILHTAQEGVVVADEGGKIIWVNPAAEHIFGWRAERLIDLPLTSLMAERHRKAYREAIAAVLRSGSLGELGKPLCLEGLRRNGTVFPMEAVISSFRQEGRWVFTAFLRDKTEERMAEKAIERAYGEL
ncbi:MAG: PAS domain-containing protein, partial [Nitrospiria bacterium]